MGACQRQGCSAEWGSWVHITDSHHLWCFALLCFDSRNEVELFNYDNWRIEAIFPQWCRRSGEAIPTMRTVVHVAGTLLVWRRTERYPPKTFSTFSHMDSPSKAWLRLLRPWWLRLHPGLFGARVSGHRASAERIVSLSRWIGVVPLKWMNDPM